MKVNLFIAAILVGLAPLCGSAAEAKPDNVNKQFIEETITLAERGDAAAQCALGACFEGGKGMLKDYEKAVMWYRRAATQGDAMAECALGSCYEKGRGVSRDLQEAALWYTHAAEHNSTRAQVRLGGLYADGLGVDRDLVQACRWYEAAAAKGDDAARKALPQLRKKLTPAQLALLKEMSATNNPPRVESSAKLADAASPATTPGTGMPKVMGGGFFITEDGYLITSAHLVTNASTIFLAGDTVRTSAKVIKVDQADDLALLKAEGKFTALPVASSRLVHTGAPVGDTAFLVGDLSAIKTVHADGEITELSGAKQDPRFFQARIPMSDSAAGGALTDDHGNVIGVLVASAQGDYGKPQATHSALKSSFLLGFLESVPEIAAKLVEPRSGAVEPASVTSATQAGAVLVMVY